MPGIAGNSYVQSSALTSDGTIARLLPPSAGSPKHCRGLKQTSVPSISDGSKSTRALSAIVASTHWLPLQPMPSAPQSVFQHEYVSGIGTKSVCWSTNDWIERRRIRDPSSPTGAFPSCMQSGDMSHGVSYPRTVMATTVCADSPEMTPRVLGSVTVLLGPTS